MGKRILVVGSGGREHALVWKLAQSSQTSALFCAPGNPGTALLGQNIPVAVNDIDGLVAAANAHRIDLVVVGPEEPLALGLVDRLIAAGIATCGPTAAAARIEASKSWAKDVMAAAGVPTAHAKVVGTIDEARRALASFGLPVVLKADGLAAGKGVVVARTADEANLAMSAFFEDRIFGEAGRQVVIEEYLEGLEVSVFGLSDGETIMTIFPACDYQTVFDADAGPITGGMGAYVPVPIVEDALLTQIEDTILRPVVREMSARGCPMRGILYAGIILTAEGPKVLEFNARFGDPEAQVIMPLLDCDLVELLSAVADGTLDRMAPIRSPKGAAVAVVFASGGYPGSYVTGIPIRGLDELPDDALVFHAGTRLDDTGRLVTAGGRVLAVVGRGADLTSAQEEAYSFASAIQFEHAHYRLDIAAREISTATVPPQSPSSF